MTLSIYFGYDFDDFYKLVINFRKLYLNILCLYAGFYNKPF